MRHTYSKKSAAPPPADDDPVPEDIDEFRDALARRINRFVGDETGAWRGCRERACRRARGCVAPHIDCSNIAPDPRTPEQQAAALAQVQHEIREALAARAGQNEREKT